ncbi:hypothetical protein CRV15_28460 (plasmid) [Streptomyces clavuligerus]|nr:hypothetical protein CRV15_28460 [Streptomyces clavuligerus]
MAEGATRAGTLSAVRARLATAARASGPGSGRNEDSGETPPGRPNKPLIAAAVLGGLVLVAVPFLVSGSDEEKPRSSVAEGPGGSPMDPDSIGQGLVPGEERVAAPGAAKGAPARPGAAPAGAPRPGGPPALTAPGPLGPVPGPQDGGLPVPGTGTGAGAPKPGGAPADEAPGAPDRKTPGTRAPAPDKKPPAKPAEPAKPATPKPAKPAKPAPAVPPPAPAPATFSHLIGLGCDTPGFATGDWYVDKNEGWLKHWGSTKSHGCNGLFYSMPMSGSSTSDGIWAQWKFYTGKVQKGLCAVEVFIPDVGNNDYVGGTPAHYTVYQAFSQKAKNVVGTFRINQPSRLGQWVSAGTYRIGGNKISVVLDNRGSGADNRHAAAGPVRVNCTAS